jgi:iron complex outermembrane receptor protein
MNFNRCASAVGLAAAALLSDQALAQETGDTSQTSLQLGAVIVTAEKREADLQDTPISIAVLSGEELSLKGVANLKDLAAGAIPTVRFAPFFGRASAPALSMRGIQSGDVTQISRDAAFGIYIDGVYLGRVQGLGMELMDVERMEVLRGPQGTLFGRNAVGGALNIVSRRPSGEFGVTAKAGLSNFDGRNLSVNLDLPSFGDLAVKIDGIYSERDGWVENPFPDQWDYNQYKKEGVRVSALWQPSELLDVYYSYDNSRDQSASGYPHMLQRTANTPPFPPIYGLDPGRVDKARLGAPLGPSLGTVEGHTLNISYDLSEKVELRSITSYRELSQSQRDQWAGAFLAFRANRPTGRYSLAQIDQDQFSQEFQVLGTSDRLKYVAGIFYFEESATDSAVAISTLTFNATGTQVTPIPLPDFRDLTVLAGSRASNNKAESRAAFTQITYTPPVLDDRLDITVGLRYTDDKKTGSLTVPSTIGYTFNSSRWDPALTLAYNWTDDVNTYVRWGTAYRAGGANSRSATFRTFGEEQVSSWEVGLKSELWNRRARLNVAAFRTNYQDLQFTFTSPANPSVTETVNTDVDVKIQGIELDATVLASEGLEFNLSYALIDRDAPDQFNPFTNQFVQTNAGFSPKHAASLSANYAFRPFSFGQLRAYADANYTGGLYTSSLTYRHPAYTLLNARLSLGDIKLSDAAGELEISLWGRNLADEAYIVYAAELNTPGLVNTLDVWYGDPRTYGLELRYRF